MTTLARTRRLRLCECGVWTYSPECGPCWLPEPEPMPPTALVVVPGEWPEPAAVIGMVGELAAGVGRWSQ